MTQTRIKLTQLFHFGSQLFPPAQPKHSIYAKEFLGIYLAFESFKHYIWGVSTKPIKLQTDNKRSHTSLSEEDITGKLMERR